MKKLLPLLLAVILVIAFALPTYAASDTYDFNGVELTTNTNIGLPLFDLWLSQGALPAYLMEFDDNTYAFYVLEFDGVYDTSTGWFKTAVDTEVTIFDLSESGIWAATSVSNYYANTPFPLGNVIWSAYDLHDTEGNIYISKDPYCFSLTTCDGSNCPATDVNMDNVCDDCGLPLMKEEQTPDTDTDVPDGFIHIKDGVYLPKFPSDANTGDGYYMMISWVSGAEYGEQYKDSTYWIFDVANSEACVQVDAGYKAFNYPNGATLQRYIYTDNFGLASALTNAGLKVGMSGWGDVNNANITSATTYGVDGILWADYELKRADGTLFFQNPPQLVEMVTGATLKGVLDQIVMILPIGLACGITWAALRKALAILRQILSAA